MSEDTTCFQSDLIFDVGMHNGEDTAFYLKKGFRVVAVEANPDLCARAMDRFRKEIETGRLIIVPRAIAHRPGPVTLWVNNRNDEWSSLARDYVDRNNRIGAHSSPLQVPAVRFAEILDGYGVPYYLKIDIEGLDHLCLEALQGLSGRPKYVSVETSGTNNFDYTLGLLTSLSALGYRRFKLVNQYMHHRISLPRPSREGAFIEHRFPRDASSGPFGEETPGSWEPVESIIEKYSKLLRLQARYTIQGENYTPLRSRLYYRLHRLLRMEPVGWYDIHASYE